MDIGQEHTNCKQWVTCLVCCLVTIDIYVYVQFDFGHTFSEQIRIFFFCLMRRTPKLFTLNLDFWIYANPLHYYCTTDFCTQKKKLTKDRRNCDNKIVENEGIVRESTHTPPTHDVIENKTDEKQK